MEGPTPSSAAFYGALSVHLGPLLLLKLRPYWAWSEILVLWVFVTGAITVLYGVLVGRTVGNYKTQLAYGIMVQIGIIYLEVALGYDYFAMLHLCGHGALRTFQFLRAGSILRDFAENPLFYPLRNDRAQTQSSRFFAKQRYFEKMREKIYSLAWNEFYMAKINSALGLCAQKMTISRTAIFRWFFSLIVFMQVGVVIAPINQALQVHLILVLGCVSVLAGFNAPRLRSRMQTIIMAHLSIFLVCFKTGVLSHSNWMAINSLLIFLLITVSFKLAEEMAQRVKSLQAISPSMGLAVVFPRQSSLFLAVFFILGISPGSLLFLAEDLLLEHMVEYGFGSLVLFLTLGLFLAVFLYRTYSQVFMGYDHQLKGFLSEKISPMIWFGRLLVVVSIVISMVPLGS